MPSQLEGRIVLVGVTRKEADGTYTQEQFAGVASVENKGDYHLVFLQCTDGNVRNYPFDDRAIQAAAPGEYRLRSTGEVVLNPDFLMTWTVTKE